MKNVSFNYKGTHPLHQITLLAIILIGGIMPMQAGMVTDTNIGDTLGCAIVHKGHTVYDDFLGSGKKIALTTERYGPYYAIIREKDNDTVRLTINIRGAGGIDRRLAEGFFIAPAGKTINKHKAWDWYDETGRVIYKEQYSENAIQDIEAFHYDSVSGLVFSDYYTCRFISGKVRVRKATTHIYSDTGALLAIAKCPKERATNNAKGQTDTRPTETTYFNPQGESVKYEKTEQVEKAVEKWIKKNYKNTTLEFSAWAAASFDVLVQVTTDGQVTMIYADSKNIFYNYVMLNQSAEHEIHSKVDPTLKQFLKDKFPASTIKCKPVLLNKTPIDCALYFTVTIALKASM